MDPFHFACPHCSSRLRVREKLYVGRQVDCPECGQSLLIVEEKGELGVKRIERPPQPAATSGARTAAPAGERTGNRPQSTAAAKPAEQRGSTALKAATGAPLPATSAAELVSQSTRRPRGILIAAGIAGVALVLLGIAYLVRPASPDLATNATRPGGAAVPNEVPGENAQRQPAADADEQPHDELSERMTKIGEALLEHVAGEQAFPTGTVPILGIVPENRLSWLAVLADRFDGDDSPVSPAWDRPWNAPQNEAFVRRRLTAFQNPAINQLTGADGYPATHFVGVAGVGADAARLDNHHPRAGVFGYDRRTRLADIPDGTSNTLLVMGVGDQLGSWAAGGPATVRGLAREPYISGPDGFGTGSSDSMQVLMADGRVITVNSKTDPRILRRMAAKADGLPLDETEPGEPGDRPSLPAGPHDPPDADNEAGPLVAPADRPIDPEFAPEPTAPAPRKIDLAVSLKQPIARFDQPRSKPLADVLVGVAEMAGAQIAIDRDELGPAGARLAEPVTLKLENTTVGDILTGLLRPAGLAYRVEGDHLKVIPRGAQ